MISQVHNPFQTQLQILIIFSPNVCQIWWLQGIFTFRHQVNNLLAQVAIHIYLLGLNFPCETFCLVVVQTCLICQKKDYYSHEGTFYSVCIYSQFLPQLLAF